jgi:hypothetical protein
VAEAEVGERDKRHARGDEDNDEDNDEKNDGTTVRAEPALVYAGREG